MLTAIGKNIVCKSIFDEVNKIIITSERRKPKYHLVLSIGEQVSNIIEGDKLHIREYSSEIVNHEGEELMIISCDTVLAKIT